jgi:hypothetical protein
MLGDASRRSYVLGGEVVEPWDFGVVVLWRHGDGSW